MTFEQLIENMTPRRSSTIGWVWLKEALTRLNTKTVEIEDTYRVISIELTGGEDYDYEFSSPMESVSYIVPNLWAETQGGRAVKVYITNKTKDGFTISSRKDCTYESVAFLVS